MAHLVTLMDDREWPLAGFDYDLPIEPASTALVVVDVQRYGIDPSAHLAKMVREHDAAMFEAFSERMETMVANIEKLLSTFRRDDRRVVYTRHGSLLRDQTDLVERRRSREALASQAQGSHMPCKGEPGHAIDERVSPQPADLVLDKNTSSAFHSTAIDLLLRNMGVTTLVMTGFAADMCVLATALDAADRGFHVIIAADGCATFDPGSAAAAQILFGRVFGYVMQTDDIVNWMTTGERPAQMRLPVEAGPS